MNCVKSQFVEMDKELAYKVVDQLARALGVLEDGPAMGIRVVVSPRAARAMLKSGHPDAESVVGFVNISADAVFVG